MTGERPRRRWRIEAIVEGDSWEDAGQAFSRVLHILMAGKPAEIGPDRPFVTTMSFDSSGLRLEVSQDPKVTPEAYREAASAYQAAAASAHGSEPPGHTD